MFCRRVAHTFIFENLFGVGYPLPPMLVPQKMLSPNLCFAQTGGRLLAKHVIWHKWDAMLFYGGSLRLAMAQAVGRDPCHRPPMGVLVAGGFGVSLWAALRTKGHGKM